MQKKAECVIIKPMKELFTAHGISLSEKQNQRFTAFREILIAENAKYNLTSITETAEINVKHFLDSAMGVSLFAQNARVVEIGSGGGFPSVPLMILRPDLQFTLVESVGKKCAFLNLVVQELGLNATVLQARAEELSRLKEYRETFDHATARAVARMNTLSEYCLPFVKVGGSFVAYKGDAEEELSEAKRAVTLLGGEIKQVKRYVLEGAGQRTLIEVYKKSPTDAKYPRGRGKERSKPL